MKAEYDQADGIFKQAVDSIVKGEFEGARGSIRSGDPAFRPGDLPTPKVKRDAAVVAMKAAEQKKAESEALAKQADRS